MIGCPARTELREGFPPEVIAAAADELDADLVVMGTRGLGGIAHLLLGSCADRTLRLAHRPLLLLPRRAWQEAEEATAAPRPLVPAAIDSEC
jgi:nucleotide-binding universal stress UspA family protein